MRTLVEGLRPGGRVDDWKGRPVRGVFLDVDGTTLGTHPRPSPVLVDACRAVQDAGLWLSFATGRPPAGLDGLRRATGSPGPYIVHNGAQVLFDRGPVRSWPLPVEAVRTLERWCLDHGVYAEFAVGSGFLVTEFREAARPSWDEISGDPEGLVSDVDLATLGPCKVTVTAFEAELLPELLALCATLDVHVDPSSAPIFPGTTIVNVTAAGVSKGSAVEWVARRAGVAPAELLVVGDSENDLSMFDVAGTAVAMGQAPAHVTARAHFVTGAFDDDGCAAALHSCLAQR
jgi:Cof subfamily protein (haloacid dehalogenase superfamily)